MLWIWTSSLLLIAIVNRSFSIPRSIKNNFLQGINEETGVNPELVDDYFDSIGAASVDDLIVENLLSQQPRQEEDEGEGNTRFSLNPDGSYSFSYDTSSHSRNETGDADNNVDGLFEFTVDGEEKKRITYEAGSDTGFIAKGKHIPIGPEVPGALSGQPTGDFDPVDVSEFIDPLNDSSDKGNLSYNFNFSSDSYSRTENVDSNGTVVGTYTVVDENGLSITYEYKAGDGIGFEIEEIERKQGPKPTKVTLKTANETFNDEPAFDVPGTPNFPSPGQSNYVYKIVNSTDETLR